MKQSTGFFMFAAIAGMPVWISDFKSLPYFAQAALFVVVFISFSVGILFFINEED